jgi:glycosyltransferase involved in cell wall biosynthesis
MLPFDLDVARTADFIVIQRQFPALHTEKLLRSLLRLRIPIVYDLDDMLLDVPASHPSCLELSRRAPFIKWALQEVDLVTASTSELKHLLERNTSRPVRVQANLVDWALFDAQPRPREREFRFLISGTSTHRNDWAILEEPLAQILAKYPHEAKVLFFGEAPKSLADHPSVDCIAFEDDYRRYASCLKSLEVHAALVPLEDSEFNRCKSNIKWLEYSAAGVPGAYSDLTPYQSSVGHRESGLLVGNSQASWLNAMDVLISDPQAVSSMISNSRRYVRDRRSIESSVGAYAATYVDIVGQEHRRQILSGVSTLASRVMARARRAVIGSPFVDRHVTWRVKKR